VSVWKFHERKQFSAHGEPVWRRNSSNVRTSLGAPKSSSPWTGRPAASLAGVTRGSDRQLDLLDVAWEARVASSKGRASWSAMTKDYWVDLSMTICRKPWSSSIRAFRPRSHLYSYEAGRCIDGKDELRILGWPFGHCCGGSDADLLNVAAEGGSLHLSTVLMLGMSSNPFGTWNSASPPA